EARAGLLQVLNQGGGARELGEHVAERGAELGIGGGALRGGAERRQERLVGEGAALQAILERIVREQGAGGFRRQTQGGADGALLAGVVDADEGIAHVEETGFVRRL